jgi:hypothetical protein
MSRISIIVFGIAATALALAYGPISFGAYSYIKNNPEILFEKYKEDLVIKRKGQGGVISMGAYIGCESIIGMTFCSKLVFNEKTLKKTVSLDHWASFSEEMTLEVDTEYTTNENTLIFSHISGDQRLLEGIQHPYSVDKNGNLTVLGPTIDNDYLFFKINS